MGQMLAKIIHNFKILGKICLLGFIRTFKLQERTFHSFFVRMFSHALLMIYCPTRACYSIWSIRLNRLVVHAYPLSFEFIKEINKIITIFTIVNYRINWYRKDFSVLYYPWCYINLYFFIALLIWNQRGSCSPHHSEFHRTETLSNS